METWSARMERQLHAKRRLCERCGKVCYDSEREAGRTIRDYHRRLRAHPYYLPGESPAMVPKRAYYDERCDTWHVTKSRAHRSGPAAGFDPGTAPVLRLPAAPTVVRGVDPWRYLEIVAVGLRDAIREQGPGMRFPSRRVLERHFGMSWPVLAQARALLVQTGWLHRVGSGSTACHVTGVRRNTETSRVDPASLSA